MKIALITRANQGGTGLGRYSIELEGALRALNHEVTIITPTLPLPIWLIQMIKRWLGWDLAVFFNDNAVWTTYPQADIYHVTSQNLATLLLFRRPPGKIVVTVHDVLPWIVRKDSQLQTYRTPIHALFDWLAMRGITRADALIAVSSYAKQSLMDHLDIAPERIVVTFEGVAAGV
jgi:glycosyltransferase involved in cell wall biosynthesis